MGTCPPARQAKNPPPSYYRRKSTIFQPCWKILNRFTTLIRRTQELSQSRNRRRKPNLHTLMIPLLLWKTLFIWKFWGRRIWPQSFKSQRHNLSWPSLTRAFCLQLLMHLDQHIRHVPAFRVEELQLELNTWLNKRFLTTHELQQLLGKLSYVSACVQPGRAFMSCLLNALRSCSPMPKRTVHPVSDDLRADITWWLYFLSHNNGVSVIPSNAIISNRELFATDTCLTGCGAVSLGECFHREFPDFIPTQDRHINELELLTIAISIKVWATKLQGIGVELLSDNATCMSVRNSQHSTNVFM